MEWRGPGAGAVGRGREGRVLVRLRHLVQQDPAGNLRSSEKPASGEALPSKGRNEDLEGSGGRPRHKPALDPAIVLSNHQMPPTCDHFCHCDYD